MCLKESPSTITCARRVLRPENTRGPTLWTLPLSQNVPKCVSRRKSRRPAILTSRTSTLGSTSTLTCPPRATTRTWACALTYCPSPKRIPSGSKKSRGAGSRRYGASWRRRCRPLRLRVRWSGSAMLAPSSTDRKATSVPSATSPRTWCLRRRSTASRVQSVLSARSRTLSAATIAMHVALSFVLQSLSRTWSKSKGP